MIDKLKGWYSHKVLPLVYTESLSYYEDISKIVKKVNEIVEFISGGMTDFFRELLNDAFVNATYDEETETITIYLDTDGV